MKNVLKNIGIIIGGIIIGGIFNMGLIMLGGIIFTPNESFEPMNATNWDLKYFIFPFLAHSIGTLSGSYLVSRLSRNAHIIFPLIIGSWFLFGGIYMVRVLPAPTWFVILDLIICYIPMSLLGWRISGKRENIL